QRLRREVDETVGGLVSQCVQREERTWTEQSGVVTEQQTVSFQRLQQPRRRRLGQSGLAGEVGEAARLRRLDHVGEQLGRPVDGLCTCCWRTHPDYLQSSTSWDHIPHNEGRLSG